MNADSELHISPCGRIGLMALSEDALEGQRAFAEKRSPIWTGRSMAAPASHPPSPAHTVRIGGDSGFWGDSSVGAPERVRDGQVQYPVFDHLGEQTLSLLAASLRCDPLGKGMTQMLLTLPMREPSSCLLEEGLS